MRAEVRPQSPQMGFCRAPAATAGLVTSCLRPQNPLTWHLWVTSRRIAAKNGLREVPIGLEQTQHALCGAQPLQDVVCQQPLDERSALGADFSGLAGAPLTVLGEEGLGFRRQVRLAGDPLAGALPSRVDRFLPSAPSTMLPAGIS